MRSATSSVHDRLDGVDVERHPMISRFLKGAFHARPPLTRYTAPWDVQVAWPIYSTAQFKLDKACVWHVLDVTRFSFRTHAGMCALARSMT